MNLAYTRVRREETSAGLYDEMRAVAELADRIGFDVIWVPEHHLIQSSQAPSCLMNLVHLGQHVSCRLGAAVCPLPYRHPLMWAGEVAAADNMVDGRLELGVARGAYPYEFDRLGVSFKDGKALFEETLQALVEQWTSESAVAHDGPHFSYPPTFVWPRPVQRPHPPIWVGGQTAPTIRWAAAQGYDVFNAAFMKPMSHVEALVRAFREERSNAGIPDGHSRFGVLRQAWVTEREDELPEAVRLVMMRQRMVTNLREYEEKADDRAYVPPDPVPDEPSEEESLENLLFGTPEQVLEKVCEYDRLGVDHLILSFTWGRDVDDVLEAVQLFGDRVLAPYRERAGLEAPAGRGAGR